MAALSVSSGRNSVNVFLDSAASNFLDLLNYVELDSVGIVNIAVRVGKCNYLSAKLSSLFGSVDSNVARTGDNYGLALEAVVLHALEHLSGVVAKTITGSLSSCERTAVRKTLTGKYANELVAKSLILTKHIADLSCTGTDVACGNVGVSANVLGKLSHEALAEAHYFSIRLALRVEVRTALAAADRKTGKAVLEDLLKAQELDYGSANRGVKSDTALVRSDSRVELYSETAVYLYFAVVVYPRHAENDLALRLYYSVDNSCLYEVRSALYNGLEGLEDLFYSLKKLGFAGISLLDLSVHAGKIFVLEFHFKIPPTYRL